MKQILDIQNIAVDGGDYILKLGMSCMHGMWNLVRKEWIHKY